MQYKWWAATQLHSWTMSTLAKHLTTQKNHLNLGQAKHMQYQVLKCSLEHASLQYNQGEFRDKKIQMFTKTWSHQHHYTDQTPL